MSIKEKKIRSALYVLLTIVFVSASYINITAQSSENKSGPKTIDKSKLVIHENLRDEQPQHFDNHRNVVLSLTPHNRIKTGHKSLLRPSSRPAAEKSSVKNTESNHKARRVRHKRVKKIIRHN